MKKQNENYFEFADSFYQQRSAIAGNRVPSEGFLELTRLCSLKCVHCYIGDARWIKDPNELTFEEVMAALDTFSASGTLWLTITGGEPLIRRDFPEIWQEAYRRGFLLSLYTNATLFDEGMARLIQEFPPIKIEVTTYGASKATYEAMTKVPGSFERFLRGVEWIRSTGVHWRLKANLVKETAGEWHEMKGQAERWGVAYQQGALIYPSVGSGESGGLAPCASRLTPEESVELELKDEAASRDLVRAAGCTREDGAGGKLFSCGAGENAFYATADGMLQMCVMTPHRAEPLRGDRPMKENFAESWKRFGQARELERNETSPCSTCDLESICGICPGLAKQETGDEQGLVEWACRQTHLKAAKLGIPHKCSVRHFVYNRPKQGPVSEPGNLDEPCADAKLFR